MRVLRSILSALSSAPTLSRAASSSSCAATAAPTSAMAAASLSQTFRLANGVEMPAVGLGTYMTSGASCEKMVVSAIQQGYRLVDTADMCEQLHCPRSRDPLHPCPLPRHGRAPAGAARYPLPGRGRALPHPAPQAAAAEHPVRPGPIA